MKKEKLIFVILILVTIITFAVTNTAENFFWFRTSDNSGVRVDPFPGGNIVEWIILTKTGYSLQNSNLVIDGNVFVFMTDEMSYGTGNNKTTINGNIYVNSYTNAKKEDFEAHCTGDVLEKSFIPPDGCWGTYDSEEDYSADINTSKNELDLKNGSISGNVFLPDWEGEITIKGNFTLDGGLFIPKASKVTIQNNPTINGGICTPNAILDITGNALIHNKLYVYFLDISGSASIEKADN